jgi:hypothetical protein
VGSPLEDDVVDEATALDEDETVVTTEVRATEDVAVVVTDLQLVVVLPGAAQANDPLRATAATNREALILKLDIKMNDCERAVERNPGRSYQSYKQQLSILRK